MSKIIKKILNLQKEKNGNISILVLVMSLAIILLTTAMVGYIFHDIGFTELDKGELRALHFAESGLSNMYYKIEQYGESGVPLPPESPESYTEYVGDPADPEGSFTVEYTIEKSGLDKYIITSTGVDISSGESRKVRVETTYINIRDYIFTGRASGAAQLAGQIKITGPFFVSGTIDDTLLGKTSFRKGPLFVKGDIKLSGNASIGEEPPYVHEDGEIYGPIMLVLGGNLYFKDKLVEDPLNPPANSNIYVSEYYHKAIDVTLLQIDDSYIDLVIKSEALVINGDLSIGDKEIKVNNKPVPGYEGYLKFNDKGILEIKGNIVVYGKIDIGKSTGPKYTIYYSGNGNLISTGNINVGSQVRPGDMKNFPSSDLMALISQNNIYLNLTNAKGDPYADPKAAVMLIANNEVNLKTKTFLRGGTVSKILYLETNTEIYYQTGIGEYLTAGIPGFGENIKLEMKWQEIR
jgi:hypothetical protein